MLRHTHVGSCNVNTLSRSPPSQLPPSPSVSISVSPALSLLRCGLCCYTLTHTRTCRASAHDCLCVFVCMCVHAFSWICRRSRVHVPVHMLSHNKMYEERGAEPGSVVESCRPCAVKMRLVRHGAVPRPAEKHSGCLRWAFCAHKDTCRCNARRCKQNIHTRTYACMHSCPPVYQPQPSFPVCWLSCRKG